MARKLVAVALVGAFVAIAWFAWREKPVPEIASEREVVVPEHAELETRVELSRDTTPVVRPNEPARVETKDDETPITAAPADGLEVIVVDGRSGVPVAGARVRGLGLLEPMSGPDERKEVPIGLLDFEIELAGGAVYETDATGRTRIPKNGVPGSYAASSSGMWGMAYFSDSEQPPHVIDMVPERGARVLVVDAHGKPAPNVPVAIACDGARFDDLVESLSDEQGFVDVRHWRSAQQKCLDAADTCVRPLLLAQWDAIPRLHVDTTRNAPDPQRLVLPPLGSVEVRVRTTDGTPLLARDLVLTRAEDKGFADHPAKDAETFEPATNEVGRALFTRVGLGCELRASSESVGAGFTVCLGPGPRAEGEVAVLELVVGRPYSLLTGRLVGSDGRALARVSGSILPIFPSDDERRPHIYREYRERGRAFEGFLCARGGFETDEAGRFRILVSQGSGEQPRIFEFSYIDRDVRSSRARVAAPQRLAQPETDLGDVRFAPLREIASGVISAPSGMPLREPWLEVSTGAGRDRVYAQRRVNPDGSFTAWSQSEAPSWFLRAGTRVCEGSLPLEIPSGATNLRIALVATSFVRGRLRVDDDVSPERYAIQLERLPDGAEGGEELFTKAGSDGRFAFALSAAGKFDVRVMDANVNWNDVTLLEGFVVEAGEDCADPRLDPIDVTREARERRRQAEADAAPTPRETPRRAGGDGTRVLAVSWKHLNLTFGRTRIIIRIWSKTGTGSATASARRSSESD